ncbi:IS3 family transposase [Amycolatopsis antarctica]|uniref:IS3 family transposase n=1 Tax=Amycolatopsis antarctica TaxID=1854586 RepID=UPI001F0B52EC|nr:IS3 family transposase [Amycolatopsis antarctica]
MPKPYPREFREDVVRVARSREPGVTIEQIANDFGVHPMTLQKWLRAVDVEDGVKPGVTSDAARELRELKRRNRLLEQENEVLRRAAAYLSQAQLPKRLYPLVKELAAAGARNRVPVAVSCRVLKLHRQHYYAWLANPVTAAELAEAYVANAIFAAHRDDPEFGYRLLFDEVTAAGHEVSDRTVWKICSANEWWCVFGKKRRGRKGRVGTPAHEDLVCREFTADEPNRLWLTDISEHPTNEGKLYICAVKDVWSNRIVGYSIADRMTSQLAVDALESAVARRGGTVANCTLHSDRGGQFRSRKLQQSLWRHQIRGSMGQVGSAGDNAAMESFFSLLQRNVLDRHRWTNREELRIAIVTWIERTYHRRRRQARLGRLTPIEYEAIMTQTATTAA